MKTLIATLSILWLMGCAALAPPSPFVSATPPNPPSNQVVILAEHGCRFSSGHGSYMCNITVKNIGTTDVGNIAFKFAVTSDPTKSFNEGFGTIKYLPAKETINLTVYMFYDMNTPLGDPVVDTFNIIMPSR